MNHQEVHKIGSQSLDLEQPPHAVDASSTTTYTPPPPPPRQTTPPPPAHLQTVPGMISVESN